MVFLSWTASCYAVFAGYTETKCHRKGRGLSRKMKASGRQKKPEKVL